MKRIFLLCTLLCSVNTCTFADPPPINEKFGENFAKNLNYYIEYSHLLNAVTQAVGQDPSSEPTYFIIEHSLYFEDADLKRIQETCNTLNCTDLFTSNEHNRESFIAMTRNLSSFFYLTPEKYEDILNYREFINFKRKAEHAALMLLQKGNGERIAHFAKKAQAFIEKFQTDYPDAFATNCTYIGDETFCWED